MSKYIQVYDSGDYIAEVELTDNCVDYVMQLFYIIVNGIEQNVLYIRDMDYGIIIPDHIADSIRAINAQIV